MTVRVDVSYKTTLLVCQFLTMRLTQVPLQIFFMRNACFASLSWVTLGILAHSLFYAYSFINLLSVSQSKLLDRLEQIEQCFWEGRIFHFIKNSYRCITINEWLLFQKPITSNKFPGVYGYKLLASRIKARCVTSVYQ